MKHYLMLLFPILLGVFCACSENKEQEEIEGANSKNSVSNTETLADSVLLEGNRIGIGMTKIGGVYQIPCVVNGVKMNFIFDTGASNVCISMTEALFLAKNGYLEDDDYIGISQSLIADGSVVENMEIMLHSIEIEGIMITDIKAVVVNSMDAPLLLGQSALQKLGKIELDGDSLFIIKKGYNKRAEDSDYQDKKGAVLSLQNPESHWYDKLLAKIGYKKKIDEYLDAAWIAYDSDLPDLSITYCKEALRLKNTVKALGVLGSIYYSIYRNTDQYEGAAQDYLLRYYRLNKKQQDYSFSDGRTMRYDDMVYKLAYVDIKNMAEYGQELYLRDNDNIKAMNLLSLAYTSSKQYDLATKWANKILDTHRDDRMAYFRLAYIANEQGRTSEAIRLYEKCLELDDEHMGALNNLANIYWKLGCNDDGSERYGKKWENMRDNAISLWRKSARLGNPTARNNIKKHGFDW